MSPKSFLTFEGRATRTQYTATALILVALKYAIDSTVAAHFGQPWHFWNYIAPPSSLAIFGIDTPYRRLYLILWAIALPFFWIGVSLTIKRLRDAGRSLRWLILFFVPVANLLLFLILATSPSANVIASLPPLQHRLPAFKKITPQVALVLVTILGLALVFFGTHLLATYAWTLFLGVPFVIGFVTSWLFNMQGLHTRAQTVAMCCLTPTLIGLGLISFRWEGLICLAMAIPLALPLSIAGGLAAYRVQTADIQIITPPNLTACVAILPLLMLAEHAANLQPPSAPVITTIVVNAPVSAVWKNVVAFPPLAPPTDWIFKTGIAYPIGATIAGTGPGAIRRCRFSTGDFVEPITTWDENHLLAFTVASEPPSMREIGFGQITTAHIEGNYMRSRHGQFRLTAIDANHTLLEGTTWYQDYFWPQVYWRPISDAIIHRIHQRVLTHVKQQAEAQTTASR